MKSPFNAMTFIFIIVAVLSLVFGVLNYRQEEAIFAKAEQATATLTEYVPDPNPKVADFCPVYKFTTKAGEDVSYIGDNCPSKPDRSKIGQTEQVYYDPENPQSIETKGWLGSEGSGLILGAVGCVFFAGLALVPILIFAMRKLFAGNPKS